MEDLRNEFDALTEQKKALWETLVARLSSEQISNYEYEREPEWEEIKKIDVQLLQLQSQINAG